MIYPRLDAIENEIKNLKLLILRYQKPKKLVSLRGIGKLLVSEKELDESIEEAKKSLFKNAICE